MRTEGSCCTRGLDWLSWPFHRKSCRAAITCRPAGWRLDAHDETWAGCRHSLSLFRARGRDANPSGFTFALIGGMLGHVGRAPKNHADEDATDRETLIRDLVEGGFYNPVRIVAFNST